MPSYELLDTETRQDGRRYRAGDQIELDQEAGDRLEAMGSVRPWGVNDHDLVDDERDLPEIMSSPRGRTDLARQRMAKRNPRGQSGDGQPRSETRQRTDGAESSAQAGEQERGREKSPGRRG